MPFTLRSPHLVPAASPLAAVGAAAEGPLTLLSFDAQSGVACFAGGQLSSTTTTTVWAGDKKTIHLFLSHSQLPKSPSLSK